MIPVDPYFTSAVVPKLRRRKWFRFKLVPKNKRKVVCVENGRIYDSGHAASHTLGLSLNAVGHGIANGKKVGGLTFKFAEVVSTP